MHVMTRSYLVGYNLEELVYIRYDLSKQVVSKLAKDWTKTIQEQNGHDWVETEPKFAQ